MQALEKSSFDESSVLVIVILPYTERSRCDQTLKSVLILFILGVKFSHSQSLSLYEKDVPRAQIGVSGHLIPKGVSFLAAFFPSHNAPVFAVFRLSPLQSP